ncbi:hypothetical protein AAZX31_03G010100 [Glycine max]|uniref:Uncharacterized protein n=2 Tax=Glycine subgen. Soja TaxID=1462606 RepID=C6SZX9_SOYBN|nr:uncharacterized protein LOC100306571 [Glycine max]XP_028224039.1 uncharacterized protein LOC114405755 [Glycine soja]ACU14802.1 unknown [Glycine max]KAG5041947.1 hypothetical protein JHK87_005862 [Glycine soja]KAG5053673.1 hypothetical protein JHK85_006183 [Glycine max]KAG5070811.1 hypothetical protein JHK86_006022 [Glycine max]KAH1068131.1 hypothetical protein GYH30_005903 [Glycine max]|eukprot:XP_003521046.1 uncharacterized protein LOC100306571 [Glycine max]
MSLMSPRTEKLVRRLTFVTTVAASYFLLTADYGPKPNALDPIKKQILSAQSTVKEYIVGSKKESQESHVGRLDSNKDNP